MGWKAVPCDNTLVSRLLFSRQFSLRHCPLHIFRQQSDNSLKRIQTVRQPVRNLPKHSDTQTNLSSPADNWPKCVKISFGCESEIFLLCRRPETGGGTWSRGDDIVRGRQQQTQVGGIMISSSTESIMSSKILNLRREIHTSNLDLSVNLSSWY